MNEGYFTSSFINQLIKLAESKPNTDTSSDDNIFIKLSKSDQESENPNQQFILKQLIKSSKFRALLMMRRTLTVKKLGIIKSFAKKREQYNISKKPVDEPLLKE